MIHIGKILQHNKEFLTFLLVAMLMPWVLGDVTSITGNIVFDSNSDNQAEMTLTTNGLGIGTNLPTEKLIVMGNAIMMGNVIVGGTTNDSKSLLHINGTIGYSSQLLTAGTNLLPPNSMVFADTSAGNIIITLPHIVSSANAIFTIKRTSTQNNLFIAVAGNTIDGLSTLVVPSGYYSSLQLMNDGSRWFITSIHDITTIAEIKSSNLHTWWKLNETSGNSVTDSSEQAHIGTLSNGHFFSGNSATGISGNALKLDDCRDEVRYSSASNLASAGYCYSFWAKYDKNSSDLIAEQPKIVGRAGFVWASSNTLYHRAAYHQLADATYVTTALSSTLSANIWYHFSTTWNGSTLCLYQNGALASSNTATSWSAGNSLKLTHPGTFSNSTVTVDDVRFFNSSLSADEIKVLYYTGSH